MLTIIHATLMLIFHKSSKNYILLKHPPRTTPGHADPAKESVKPISTHVNVRVMDQDTQCWQDLLESSVSQGENGGSGTSSPRSVWSI